MGTPQETPSEPPPRRPLVLLATCPLFPEGEPGAPLLTAALVRRGLDARWEPWSSPAVPWSSAALVAARTTWDYHEHLPAFLAWAGALDDEGGRLLHGRAAFAWNTDKKYLPELAGRGVPAVPTVCAATVADVLRAAGQERSVVKPAVGVNGFGVEIVPRQPREGWRPGWEGPWVVQPFVETVETEGEVGVVLLDGEVRAGVRKMPGKGDWRVNEDYGGRVERVELDSEQRGVALKAWRVTEELLGVRLAYMRVDLLSFRGRWVVSEVEITEPGLYFDMLPELAEGFADMVVARIGEGGEQVKEKEVEGDEGLAKVLS